MLREKLDELDVKIEYLKSQDWKDIGMDTLPELLAKENIESHFEGEILTINNGEAEIAFVKIFGKIWQVCYGWIPLWHMYSYWECMSEELKGGSEYFAIPVGDQDGDEKRSRKALIKIGFETSPFEGF